MKFFLKICKLYQRNFFLLIFAVCSLLLSSCSSVRKEEIVFDISVAKEIAARSTDNTTNEAASSISKSLYNLHKLEDSKNPQQVAVGNFDYMKYGMGRMTSIDWSGPIEQLLREVAMLSHYKIYFIGKAPNIPIIVTVNQHNVMLGQIFEDAVVQVNNQVDVNVYYKERLIELVYKEHA